MSFGTRAFSRTLLPSALARQYSRHAATLARKKTKQPNPTLNAINQAHQSPEGLICRGVKGLEGTYKQWHAAGEPILPNLEVHRLNEPVKASASVLIKGPFRQTPFSDTFFLVNHPKVDSISLYDQDLLPNTTKKWQALLPISVKCFPNTHGRTHLVTAIQQNGGDPEISMSSLSHQSSDAKTNEIIIRYTGKQVMGIGIYSSKESTVDLQEFLNKIPEENYDALFTDFLDKGFYTLEDKLADAVYSQAVLATSHPAVPIVIFNGDSFTELEIPTSLMDAAEKHFESHQNCQTIKQIKRKQHNKHLFTALKVVLFLLALKETFTFIKESLEKDPKQSLKTLAGNTIQHNAEGLEHLANSFTDENREVPVKLLTASRLMAEAAVLRNMFASALAPHAFPLKQLPVPLRLAALALLTESQLGHAIHQAATAADAGPLE